MVPHYSRCLAFPRQWGVWPSPAVCTKMCGALGAPHDVVKRRDYFSASSVTAWVQAPSGSLEMTGSEPPPSRVATVRL